MKRRSSLRALAIIFVTVLCVGLAPTAAAEGRHCSNRGVAGKWGYTYTGSIITPTGAVPVASVGRFTLDAQGNISGTQTRSNVGTSAKEFIEGTLTVNGDCTAEATIDVSETEGGPVVRTAVVAFVFVNNEQEARAIFESLTLANGASVPVVITVNGKKQFEDENR